MARQSKDGSFASDRPKRDFSTLGPANGAVQEGTFAWGYMDPALMLECIDVVTMAGDGVSFAAWRNKRGGTVTILAGDQTPKHKVETLDDADALLRKIVALYKT